MNPNALPAPPTCIILAAGKTPSSLLATYGRTSPAMLPVGGRPVIHWIMETLLKVGIQKFIVGINGQEDRLPNFLNAAFGQTAELEIIRLEEDFGPGYTLARCLAECPSRSALIVLGDTLFSLNAADADWLRSWILISPVDEASRWCLTETDSNGKVLSLADKPLENPSGWPALIGVYHLSDIAPASESLSREIASGNRSVQIRHALQPYIDAGELIAEPAKDWMDCGNLDLYNQARRRLLRSREFNTITLDPLRGTLRKTSRDRPKLLNEINFYRLLPADLSIFFPRLVEFDVLREHTYLTQEYYGYPTLSELWVFEEHDDAFWTIAMRRIADALSEFARYESEVSPDALADFYMDKTRQRIDRFCAQGNAFKELAESETVKLNRKHLSGWPLLHDRLEEELKRICQEPRTTIIHGDPCFPNILYDPASHTFKFIDPRGNFAGTLLYGDPRYDAAKILHSIHGGYDLIIQDLFRVTGSGAEWELAIFFPPNRDAVLAAWRAAFGARFDEAAVRLIEATLFLSMTPLHSDFPPRQTAMFLTGLRLLNEILGS